MEEFLKYYRLKSLKKEVKEKEKKVEQKKEARLKREAANKTKTRKIGKMKYPFSSDKKKQMHGVDCQYKINFKLFECKVSLNVLLLYLIFFLF